ncbi:MAG: hypothetical protein WCP97_05995 [bacterium]
MGKKSKKKFKLQKNIPNTSETQSQQTFSTFDAETSTVAHQQKPSLSTSSKINTPTATDTLNISKDLTKVAFYTIFVIVLYSAINYFNHAYDLISKIPGFSN